MIIVLILFIFIKRSAKRIQETEKLSRSRYYMLKKVINIFSLILWVTTFVLIWGISIKSLWVSISGIIAMIAVAFFAIWSLIGNILAGIILYFTSPFKIGDKIQILPEEIQGKVLAINIFFYAHSR